MSGVVHFKFPELQSNFDSSAEGSILSIIDFNVAKLLVDTEFWIPSFTCIGI